MFIAHVQVFDADTPQIKEDISFTCQDHSQNELIVLMQRWISHTNELNGTNKKLVLLSMSDVSQSLAMSDLIQLGCTQLTRDQMLTYRNQILENRKGASFKVETKALPDYGTEEPVPMFLNLRKVEGSSQLSNDDVVGD